MFALLKLLPAGVQIGMAVAAFVIVTGTITTISVKIYNRGYASAISAVAERNKVAIDAVRKGTTRVQDCYAGGGSWDATDGVCH